MRTMRGGLNAPTWGYEGGMTMSWQEQSDEGAAQREPAPAGFTRIQNKLLETLALARLNGFRISLPLLPAAQDHWLA